MVDRYRREPGYRPPSKIPSRQRTTTNPAKLLTKPTHITEMPHSIARRGRQSLGVAFFRNRFDGTSATT
jgi:hypothetical protein